MHSGPLQFIKAPALALAFACTSLGWYLFGEIPEEEEKDTGTKAALIFRLTLAILLSKLKVYPRSLQKLGRYMQCLIEFLLGMYVIEYLQGVFWLSLEVAIKKGMGKLSEVSSEVLRKINEDGDFDYYCDLLANEWTICFVVYGVSLFFLFATLYATRIIDLRTTKYGHEPFWFAKLLTYKTFLELIFDFEFWTKGAQHYLSQKQGGNNGRIDCQRMDNRNSDQKSIEWRKETDGDSFFDEVYSDFEMYD